MGKTFNFKSRWETEYEIFFEKCRYEYGDTLAIEVWCREHGQDYWEPYSTMTVNIDGHWDDMAYLDTNNCPDMAEFVIGKGWAEKVGEGRSGYCTYPLVRFTDEFLNEICEEVN